MKAMSSLVWILVVYQAINVWVSKTLCFGPWAGLIIFYGKAAYFC